MVSPDKGRPSGEEHQRVVVYVPTRLHRELRSKLALRGLSVSEWFRRMAENYVRERG